MKESKSAATIRRRRPPANSVGVTSVICSARDQAEDDEEPDEDCEVPRPRMIRALMSSEKSLLMGLLVFRMLNSLIIQTSYVPDEYWQSVEVAHRMAFGYGYLTWEWLNGLRSYSYPMIFAFFYKLLSLFHLDSTLLLIKLPRMIQACFAAVGDLYTYKLTRRLAGRQAADWTIVCQLTSWFTFYCCTRTLTNSLEGVLTAVALYYYPWPNRPRLVQWKYIVLVAISIVLRPTAAITWVPLCIWHVQRYRHAAWRIVKYFTELGLLVLIITSIIDRLFYGRWVSVQYNFLQFNVLYDMGRFYGVHPAHWYITQGLAVVLTTHLVIMLIGLWRNVEPVFLAVIGWTVVVYSTLSHKEFRFLCGVLPLIMHVCGITLYDLTKTTKSESDTSPVVEANNGVQNDSQQSAPKIQDNGPIPSRCPAKEDSSQSAISPQPRIWKMLILVIMLGVNIPIALYTSLIHQRGTIDVMNFLHKEVLRSETLAEPADVNVLFLMPCHSTPYYSYIHRNISMRFLTCEPNVFRRDDHVDEADLFYHDPSGWLNEFILSDIDSRNISHAYNNKQRTSNYSSSANNSSHNMNVVDGHPGASRILYPLLQTGPSVGLPTHVVMFDELHITILPWLRLHSYRLCFKAFHTHFPEGRVSEHVLVMCR